MIRENMRKIGIVELKNSRHIFQNRLFIVVCFYCKYFFSKDNLIYFKGKLFIKKIIIENHEILKNVTAHYFFQHAKKSIIIYIQLKKSYKI